MNKFWKFTIGLAIEVAIKLFQQFVSSSDNVIKGTGSNSTTEQK